MKIYKWKRNLTGLIGENKGTKNKQKINSWVDEAKKNKGTKKKREVNHKFMHVPSKDDFIHTVIKLALAIGRLTGTAAYWTEIWQCMAY